MLVLKHIILASQPASQPWPAGTRHAPTTRGRSSLNCSLAGRLRRRRDDAYLHWACVKYISTWSVAPSGELASVPRRQRHPQSLIDRHAGARSSLSLGLPASKHRRQCTTRRRVLGSVSGYVASFACSRHRPCCCKGVQVGEHCYHYCVRYHTIVIHSRCTQSSLLHSEEQDSPDCCFPGTTTRIPSQFTFAVPRPLSLSLIRPPLICPPASYDGNAELALSKIALA